MNNAIRKINKYEDLMKSQKHQYDSVKFISLSISTLVVSSIHSANFPNILKETGLDDKQVNYTIREEKIGTIQNCYLPYQILYSGGARGGLGEL